MTFTNLRRTQIHFPPSTVQSMLALLSATPLPPRPPLDSPPWSLGIDYDFLIELRRRWLEEWSCEALEGKMNEVEHFLVDYADADEDVEGGEEGGGKYEMTLHFVHQRSPREDAIPLLIMHGWPGTTHDFHKTLTPLTSPPSPSLPAFHVIAPSLPGFFLSTLPRRTGFDLTRVAKLFNSLMVDALGYDKYVAQGGDWGAMTLRIMAALYPSTCVAAHFTMFRAVVSPALDTSKFTPSEKEIIRRREEFASEGFGYNLLQQTKPLTIGLALSTSPLALLTYIGEKFYAWSDTTSPNTQFSPLDLLDTVSLYYLTNSFASSVMIYNQSRRQRAEVNEPADRGLWRVKTKGFGFSAFPYEIGSSPRAPLEAYGNLTFYKEHTRGGHFPALDNPEEFVDDLREFFGLKEWVA